MKKLSKLPKTWSDFRPINFKIGCIITLIGIIIIFNLESKERNLLELQYDVEKDHEEIIVQKRIRQSSQKTYQPVSKSEIQEQTMEEIHTYEKVDSKLEYNPEDSNNNVQSIQMPDNSYKLPLPEESHKIEEFKPEKVFVIAEKMPILEECVEKFDTYEEQLACTHSTIRKTIVRNLRYPPLARENGIQAKLTCELIITKNGDLKIINAHNSPGYGMADAVKDVLINFNSWIPGQQNKENVNVKLFIPVHFKLENN